MQRVSACLAAIIFIVVAATSLSPVSAQAQENAWVQIEAVPTLAIAQQRAAEYSGSLSNVNGFRAGRWYAIALGPFTPEGARQELIVLRQSGLIPRDSFITRTSDYALQFWPIGGTALTARPLAPTAPQQATPAAEAADPEAEADAALLPVVPDETPREARASERLLTGAERRELQEALQWFGYYAAAIDGAFGAGTRRAMQQWQAAEGFEATGILTTAQRAVLLEAYRAPFEALGLRLVRNDAAGIEMIMPAGRVSYTRTEAPFVHYDSADGSGMRVLLISQEGDEATLFGLYDIMQTLEIVPPDGPRRRDARRFELRGESPGLKSHTTARVVDGAVKGFTLVWQDEDPRVIERVIAEMEASFVALPSVLPDTAREGDLAEQRIDLLSGLQLRTPERTRSGFFVDASGLVLTTRGATASCQRVTIGDDIEVRVAAEDDALGLALLRPAQALAPLAVARFQGRVPRLQSEVAVAGYPYGAALDLPLLTYGRLADLRGLDGAEDVNRLDLAAQPGDAGGPVFDATGAVLGVLQGHADAEPQASDRQRLPEGVAFAVDVPAIETFLGAAGLALQGTSEDRAIAPEDLANLAADLTVPVNCWN